MGFIVAFLLEKLSNLWALMTPARAREGACEPAAPKIVASTLIDNYHEWRECMRQALTGVLLCDLVKMVIEFADFSLSSQEHQMQWPYFWNPQTSEVWWVQDNFDDFEWRLVLIDAKAARLSCLFEVQHVLPDLQVRQNDELFMFVPVEEGSIDAKFGNLFPSLSTIFNVPLPFSTLIGNYWCVPDLKVGIWIASTKPNAQKKWKDILNITFCLDLSIKYPATYREIRTNFNKRTKEFYDKTGISYMLSERYWACAYRLSYN